jgi:hypothetical protein
MSQSTGQIAPVVFIGLEVGPASSDTGPVSHIGDIERSTEFHLRISTCRYFGGGEPEGVSGLDVWMTEPFSSSSSYIMTCIESLDEGHW